MDLNLFRRRRSMVLSGGLAVITISGALIGATLKSRDQFTVKEESRKKAETDRIEIDEQIALLESTRARLVRQRDAVADKVQEIKRKAKKREELDRQRKKTAENVAGGQ